MFTLTRRRFLAAAQGFLGVCGLGLFGPRSEAAVVATSTGEGMIGWTGLPTRRTEEEQYASDLDYLQVSAKNAWELRVRLRDPSCSAEQWEAIRLAQPKYSAGMLDHLVEDLRQGRTDRVVRLMKEIHEYLRDPGMMRCESRVSFPLHDFDMRIGVQDQRLVPRTVFGNPIRPIQILTPRQCFSLLRLTSNRLTEMIIGPGLDVASERRQKLDIACDAAPCTTYYKPKVYDTELEVHIGYSWDRKAAERCIDFFAGVETAGRVYGEDELDYIHVDAPFGCAPLTITRYPKQHDA